MRNKDSISKTEAEMKHSVEVEIAGASALMEAEALLESKNTDYVLGFLKGFAHCLELIERFDAINKEKNERTRNGQTR